MTTSSWPTVSVSSTTRSPPTTRITAVPTSVTVVTASEKSDSCQVRRTRARAVSRLVRANRPCSCRSRAKLLIAAMDRSVS